MKILFKNEMEYNSSIIVTNESLNYPVRNLVHPFLHQRFQSNSTSSLITVSFPEDKCMSCLFWGFHTMSNFQADFKNSIGTVLLSLNISTIPNIQVDRQYFSLLTTVRSIEFTVTGSQGVFLGGIGVGCCYEMPNFLSVYGKDNVDNSISISSDHGQTLQNYIKPLRAYPFDFDGLNGDIIKEIDLQYTSVGVGKPLFMDLFNDKEPPIYAKIVKSFNYKIGKTANTFPLQILECR